MGQGGVPPTGFDRCQNGWVQKLRGRSGSGSVQYCVPGPLTKYLFPTPAIWGSAGPADLVSEEGMLPPGDPAPVPLNGKLRQPQPAG